VSHCTAGVEPPPLFRRSHAETSPLISARLSWQCRTPIYCVPEKATHSTLPCWVDVTVDVTVVETLLDTVLVTVLDSVGVVVVADDVSDDVAVDVSVEVTVV
jgi:hypothetical protein